MAQLIQPFNAKQYDPKQSAGSLPVGKHPVVIVASEVKTNSANNGGFLQLDLQIIDGPNKGQTGVFRLNLYNASQKAVEIAHRQLSAICHVIGVFNVQDSSQLHNLPFLIEVGMQAGEEAAQKGYTEVKKVFDINGNEPGKAGQGAAPQQPQQQPAQQQPQGQPGGFAQQPAQQQAPAQQQPAAWGQGQQPAQQPQQPQGNGAPAWGQPPAQQQAPAQQQPAAAGWQQGAAPAGGAAPWGQR